jgi:hypothetical protein
LCSHDHVEIRPIVEASLGQIGQFLHANLNRRVSAAQWASIARPPWSIAAPNHGFMLVAGARIVGVYLAFYSKRVIDDEIYPICNLAAWSVLEDFRAQGLRLLRAILSQKGYHFTDLSPSGNVVPLNIRLGFRVLDTAAALVPNFLCPLWLRSARVIAEPLELERLLEGCELEIYKDHVNAKAVRHLLLIRGSETCYVIFRKDRRKNLPLFASILYVGNIKLFESASHHVYRYILMHYGIPFTIAELRIVGHKPRFSTFLRKPRPKMYKGELLRPDQIDYLYSELTCVEW